MPARDPPCSRRARSATKSFINSPSNTRSNARRIWISSRVKRCA